MSANEAVAELFEAYADVLEAQGDDYRPRSYRRAAENVRDYPEPVEDLVAEGEDAVREIEGVGESLAEKIVEYVETGEIDAIEEAREEFPVDMEAITAVEGVGPKRAGDFYRELGVTTLDELEAAAREERIRDLDGYGAKTEENVLAGIEFARRSLERRLLGEARPVGESVREHLRADEAIERVDLAGSLRRWRETIGDVDVLAAGTDRAAIVDRFRDWGDETIEAGESKASVRIATTASGRLSSGEGSKPLRVDLRVVDPDEWGAALQYFTGSKEHNVRLRNRAIEMGLKVNEYGVFDVGGDGEPRSESGDGTASDASDGGRETGEAAEPTSAGERVAGETEASVYQALDVAWIPPELREDRGEIDAAANGALPDLVEVEDVRGDLHVHTEWSDGGYAIADMLAAADEFGHEYVCVTDHASGPGVVGGMGLDDGEIREQVAAVREASESVDVEVFAGIEANLDVDGEVSVGEDVLADLDIVIASPHSGLDGDGTQRLLAAVEHPEVDVIGHPSGRILNGRPGLELDVERIAEAAAKHDTALEVNANPHRLDLWDDAVKTAARVGAPIAIDTDAHSPEDYGLLEYGVRTARRGWAEPADVINARTADGLREFLDS